MNDSRPLTGVVLVAVLTLMVAGAVPVAGAVLLTVQPQQTTPNTTNATTTTVGTMTVDAGDPSNATPEQNVTGDDRAPGTQSGTVTVTNQSGEPNDDWENATGAVVGQTVLESLGDGDHDWYVYQLTGGGDTVKVSVAAGDSANLSAFLYRSGELLDSTYVFSGESTTLSGPFVGGGPYYVLIRDEGDAGTGQAQYAFTLYTEGTASATGDSGGSGEEGGSEGGGGLPWTVILIAVAVIAAIVLFVYSVGDEEGEAE